MCYFWFYTPLSPPLINTQFSSSSHLTSIQSSHLLLLNSFTTSTRRRMNISGSQYSSGCESGWTMYLDQHTNNSADQYNSNPTAGAGVYAGKVAFSGEDEDLSMVSDASSGPPHFHDVDECYVQSDYVCYSSAFELRKGKQKKKKSEEQRGSKNQSYYLDDTASSPTTTFPVENASLYNDRPSKEHVPGISETHFKGKSVLGKHFGFLKSSGKAASKKCDGVKGRNWQ